MTANVLCEWEDEPYPSEPSRPADETTSRDAEDDIFDDVTDDVGGIILSGVRPGASFPKKPTADEPEARRVMRGRRRTGPGKSSPPEHFAASEGH
jgi:hypothetical protein